MLPKRKFIKKQYVAQESTHQTEQQQTVLDLNIIEQLKSDDEKVKGDAISAIANIQSIKFMDQQFQEELYSSSTLLEIIKVLSTSANQGIIQTAIFAINNLCINETQANPIDKTVKNLFQNGLDKALLQLDSSNTHLIKPILILMGNVAQFIPIKYRYLLQLLQRTLINDSQKYLKQSPYYDLIVQFLMKSNTQIKLQLDSQPEHLKFLKSLQNIAQIDKMYKNKAMACRVLLFLTQGKSKEHIQVFCNIFEQFINEIDLQKQYNVNLKPILDNMSQLANQVQENDIQINDEEEQMQQQKIAKHKGKKNSNKVQEKNQKNQQILKENNLQIDSSYAMFLDALQGIQVILEFVVQQLEDQNNTQDEQEMQQQYENVQLQNDQNYQFDKTLFLSYIQNCIRRIIPLLHKFTKLSFIEGQNILQLILRLMLSLPVSIVSNSSLQNKILTSSLVGIVEQIIINQFKFQISHPHEIPQQIFIFNLKTALQIILKYKMILNRSIYTELPYLKYQTNKQSKQGIQNRVMHINSQWKQCWIIILEIYSMFYNPQKVANTNQAQNRSIGGVLKRLILQIPEIELEQWRGQTIDTLFDIYSNQNFDTIFMQYGFIQILTEVLKVSGNNSNNNKFNKKNSKKTNKFVTAVINDIQRFIAYKKKMIGF